MTIAPEPPSGSYHQATLGWLSSEESPEWLYKPSSGVYFHTPSESLWKKDRSGESRFVRLDPREGALNSGRHRGYELAIKALVFGGATPTALVRVCFISWGNLSKQSQKFEEMQRDLDICCEAARSTGGMKKRPSISPPGATSSQHQAAAAESEAGLWTGLARLLGLPLSPSPPPTTADIENDENVKPSPSERSRILAAGLTRKSSKDSASRKVSKESPSRKSSKGSPNQDSAGKIELALNCRTLAMHNLQQPRQSPELTGSGLLRRGRSQDFGQRVVAPGLTRSKSLELGLGALGDRHKDHDSLAFVHLSKETLWRSHSKQNLVIEEALVEAPKDGIEQSESTRKCIDMRYRPASLRSPAV